MPACLSVRPPVWSFFKIRISILYISIQVRITKKIMNQLKNWILLGLIISLVNGNPFMMYSSPWNSVVYPGNFINNNMYSGMYGRTPYQPYSPFLNNFSGFGRGGLWNDDDSGISYMGLYGRGFRGYDDFDNNYSRYNRGSFGRLGSWDDFDRYDDDDDERFDD